MFSHMLLYYAVFTHNYITVNRNEMVGLAADVTEYLIVLNLFASRDRKAVRYFKRLYIFLYEWIIFPNKMSFFRLSDKFNSKHMFVMVHVKNVEMQISLYLKQTSEIKPIWRGQNISHKSHFG